MTFNMTCMTVLAAFKQSFFPSAHKPVLKGLDSF